MSIFRPIFIAEIQRDWPAYLFSGAMARESVWILARSIPPIEKPVAWLTAGMMFKFPIARVDDINVLRPGFDVAGPTTQKRRWPRSGTSPIRFAASIWLTAPTTT